MEACGDQTFFFGYIEDDIFGIMISKGCEVGEMGKRKFCQKVGRRGMMKDELDFGELSHTVGITKFQCLVKELFLTTITLSRKIMVKDFIKSGCQTACMKVEEDRRHRIKTKGGEFVVVGCGLFGGDNLIGDPRFRLWVTGKVMTGKRS
jgi:hypothetical protein